MTFVFAIRESEPIQNQIFVFSAEFRENPKKQEAQNHRNSHQQRHFPRVRLHREAHAGYFSCHPVGGGEIHAVDIVDETLRHESLKEAQRALSTQRKVVIILFRQVFAFFLFGIQSPHLFFVSLKYFMK